MELGSQNSMFSFLLQLVDIRWLLAALILFGLLISFILTFTIVPAISLHRRHIRKIAAREGKTIAFFYRGPSSRKFIIAIFGFYLILAIVEIVLTLLGIVPISVSPAMEDRMMMAAMILLVILIDGLWPTSMIAALILSVRDHREALRIARSK
jgi:hypothetical protein